ncbi:hypothetical protein ATI53_1002221 [Salipiger aestuarii]|uniref:Uncharacterized protein n=1 Tax=Salipiger aestuarii TaxID=568098 RepID=A0A327YR87_9RHOB|nr:hypothetical protein ATI53_1002221 [Salipiger aestuarii]
MLDVKHHEHRADPDPVVEFGAVHRGERCDSELKVGSLDTDKDQADKSGREEQRRQPTRNGDNADQWAR